MWKGDRFGRVLLLNTSRIHSRNARQSATNWADVIVDRCDVSGALAQVSSDQNHGWLGYIWDYTTKLYRY